MMRPEDLPGAPRASAAVHQGAQPSVSVIVPVYNQAARLKLTLAALEVQEYPRGLVEVIVVDDGSRDGTAMDLGGSGRRPWLRCLRREDNSGSRRGVPRNLGADAADGQLLVFLDADALPSRELVAAHVRLQEGHSAWGMGNLRCIAQTEWLQDPARGTLFEELDGEPVDWSSEPLRSLRASVERPAVTEHMIMSAPAAIAAMSRSGPYPWLGRLTSALEQIASWPGGHAAAFLCLTTHNCSVPKAVFKEVGAFDCSLGFKEGWGLGYRLQRAGIPASFAPKAVSFHLYHHHSASRLMGDLLKQREADGILAHVYPELPCEWAWLFLQSLHEDPFIPPEVRLDSIDELHAVMSDPAAASERRRKLRSLFARHPYFLLGQASGHRGRQ